MRVQIFLINYISKLNKSFMKIIKDWKQLRILHRNTPLLLHCVCFVGLWAFTRSMQMLKEVETAYLFPHYFLVGLTLYTILNILFLISLVLKEYMKGFTKDGPRIVAILKPCRPSIVRTIPVLVKIVIIKVGP